jgi:hypothetical protein
MREMTISIRLRDELSKFAGRNSEVADGRAEEPSLVPGIPSPQTLRRSDPILRCSGTPDRSRKGSACRAEVEVEGR